MSERPQAHVLQLSPEVEKRVRELTLELLAVPLAVNGLAWLIGRAGGDGAWMGSTGVFAFTTGPSLCGAGLLFLTHAVWAAWSAWGLEVLLFGLLALGDVFFTHHVSVRIALVAVLMPLVAARIVGLGRLARR